MSPMAFGKIFESLYTGSMIGAGPVVFAVWTYAIANAKPPGLVELNPALIAVLLGCPESQVVEALEYLQAPDPKSRSKEHDGRRLLHEGAFTYTIPTWPHYNALRNDLERREKNRLYQREHRKRKRDGVSSVSPDGADSA